MVAAMMKTGMLVAALGGMTAVTGDGQDALDRYQTQLANGAASAVDTANNAALASAIAQWKAVQQTDALPFDTYATFLLAHHDWPGEARLRRLAEKKAGDGVPPARIIAFFDRFPPLTAAGRVRYALALQATGQRARATTAARDAWRDGALSSEDEAAVLSGFAGALTPADQAARMDMLLWQGATTSAARQLALVAPADRDVYAARLAFRTDAPDAAQIATATMDRFSDDAGYIADRAEWLKRSGAWPSARSWLARTRHLTTRPARVAAWYDILLSNAQGAAHDDQWQTAYDIARQVDDAYPAGTDVSTRSYAERDAYTDLVWLAGQAALTKLNRPADAMTLFERYANGSGSPQVTSKGLYWAGRAAQAAGRSADATAYLTRAAGYRDSFYGQLAAERLGKPLAAPPPTDPRPVAVAERATFYASEPVRAARFLGTIGDHDDQTAFVRQIATDATTDADHVLAAELSRSIGRPDLGVMVGRSALRNGLTDYARYGYPTVPVPDAYSSDWTMIHAIARQESQFDRAAVSHAGARGLMQLMPGTAREAAGKLGLDYKSDALTADTGYNIALGDSYFQRIFNLYGSYPLAIAAYNAGPGNVNKWIAANGDPRTPGVDMVDWMEAIPFSETRNYVQRVLENAVVYDLISPDHAKSHGPANLSWYLGKNQPG